MYLMSRPTPRCRCELLFCLAVPPIELVTAAEGVRSLHAGRVVPDQASEVELPVALAAFGDLDAEQLGVLGRDSIGFLRRDARMAGNDAARHEETTQPGLGRRMEVIHRLGRFPPEIDGPPPMGFTNAEREAEGLHFAHQLKNWTSAYREDILVCLIRGGEIPLLVTINPVRLVSAQHGREI
jgi:hypothetical protein